MRTHTKIKNNEKNAIFSSFEMPIDKTKWLNWVELLNVFLALFIVYELHVVEKY